MCERDVYIRKGLCPGGFLSGGFFPVGLCPGGFLVRLCPRFTSHHAGRVRSRRCHDANRAYLVSITVVVRASPAAKHYSGSSQYGSYFW